MQRIKFSFNDRVLQRSFFVTKGLISHSHHFLNHFALRKWCQISSFHPQRYILSRFDNFMLAASKHPSMVANVAYIIRQSWQPIVVESLIPSNCSTTRVARMSAAIFLFVRFRFHSCRVVGHSFRAFCVILFFGGCSFGEI